jgi:hypothetical protein
MSEQLAMNDQPTGADALAGHARAAAGPPARTRRFPWLGNGLRLYILILAGGLVIVVAREWDGWVGSAVLQSTDDAYLQAERYLGTIHDFVLLNDVADTPAPRAANLQATAMLRRFFDG